jgi:hypothetical protein
MHCVENLFCVVLGAHAHQFQEAKGPETKNQLRTALPENALGKERIAQPNPHVNRKISTMMSCHENDELTSPIDIYINLCEPLSLGRALLILCFGSLGS